jgi:predicted nucleotidyltransferase
MLSQEELSRWAEVIAEHFQPERILLFGSYATGKAHQDSDVDLMVIMPYDQPQYKHRRTRAAAKISRFIRDVLGYWGALDVMVRSPQEFEERLKLEDLFIRGILKTGKTLYSYVCATPCLVD